jgi:hypothetical protein
MSNKLNLAYVIKREEQMSRQEMEAVGGSAPPMEPPICQCIHALDQGANSTAPNGCTCGSIWVVFGLDWGG